MLDTISQLLLGVRWVVFGQGELRLAPPAGFAVAALLAVVAVAATVITYRRAPRRLASRDRVVLATLRTALVALLLLCLLRPMLVLRAAVPHQNVVAVLLDDSRSMRIADVNGQPRSAYVQEQFGAADRGLRRALGERFTVRTLRFSSGVSAAPAGADLTFDGSNTRLAAALDQARRQMTGVPLAGLVVVSDGADTTGDAVEPALLALKAAGVPVFAIGVGRDTAEKDIQVGRVTAPRAVLAGTTLLLDAVVTAHGYAGQSLTMDVLDGATLAGSQSFTVGADGQPTTVRVRFTAAEPGPRVFTFRVAPQPGELLPENNARDVLVDVRDRREKILYFEGEPRFEMKFLRRAVTDDKHLQLVSLLRTADNKYYRQDVDDPDELVGGFPKTRDELFKYRGIVLGSIEAAAFTGDQLAMLAEFVDRRGGGLMMLGGPRAFSEGGYAGTALGDTLPVVLQRMTPPAEPVVATLAVRPTRAGSGHAVSQIAATDQASATRWTELPDLTTVNNVDTVKPGATTLLGATDGGRRERPVLAFQRFGRGKSAAFTPQDSWLWQMHASISVEDQTHETFTRQLLRWLVDGVPDPVELTTASDRVDPGEPLNLSVEVTDASFVAASDAVVTATVTGPDGTATTVPLTWNGQRDGLYTGTAPTGAAGWYEARVEAMRGETLLGQSTAHVKAGPGDAEFSEATRQMAALRRLADDTGGKAYTPETAERLLEDVKYTGRGITAVEERELWNAPIVLVLLLGLLMAEWGTGVPLASRNRAGRLAVAAAFALAVGVAVVTAQSPFRGEQSRRRGAAVDYDASTRVAYDGRFAFVRLRYDMGQGLGNFRGFRREPPWAHDYPRADLHLMKILSEITLLRPHLDDSAVLTLDDPELHNYPVAYMSEPGYWTLTDREAEGLRSYLAKGGFLIFDDFRQEHWSNFEAQMRRVLPAQRFVRLDATHPVFHAFFEIDPATFVSPYGGLTPIFYGLFEDGDPAKRLQVIANYNNDLGEYWEFSDTGWVPIDLSNEAYKFGVNYIVYGMTH